MTMAETLASGSLTSTVVLIGNPNSGKTTVFNRLTGLRQKVGNYPGVTVERKEGRLTLAGRDLVLIDLPGTYSLSAYSPDEMITVDVLLGNLDHGRPPDMVIQVADASNLERNLYLLSQVRELGVPIVLVLTMLDVAGRRGLSVDCELLSERLGVPVVGVHGQKGTGFELLGEVLRSELAREPLADDDSATRAAVSIDDALHRGVDALHREIAAEFERVRRRRLHPFEVLRAVIDRGGHAESRLTEALSSKLTERLSRFRDELRGREHDEALPSIETRRRYAWVRERLGPCLRSEPRESTTTWSDRLDAVLTHRVLGLVLFAVIMVVVFQSIFTWALPLMDWIDGLFSYLKGLVASALSAGALRSLIVDGVIGGVGMVIIFLPQILILFLFIGILEDCGYMARAAFMMDRIMSACGLSGKSFIPMLSGFACAIPGVMAARVIEDRRDRLATILVTPLMSCSARLPVYSILIAGFIPKRQVFAFIGLPALTLFGLYALGVVTAVAVAWTLRKSLLKGPKLPFVLELPSYKWPVFSTVLLRLLDRAKAFLLRAGTIILAVSIVVWALSYFPHSASISERHDQLRDEARAELTGPGLEAREAQIERLEKGEFLRESYFGTIGHAVAPVFEPLGWDWRVSMAAIASFPAREILVSVLGTTFNLGDVNDKGSEMLLRDTLKEARRPDGSLLITIPVALSVMVFFALCCQCAATLATIKRETNSWSWPVFTFVYMTALAYVAAWITYQVGSRLG